MPLCGHLVQNMTFHNEGTKCHVTLPVLKSGDWYCYKTMMWVQRIKYTAATNTNSVSSNSDLSVPRRRSVFLVLAQSCKVHKVRSHMERILFSM